jgi:hypothetical protein
MMMPESWTTHKANAWLLKPLPNAIRNGSTVRWNSHRSHSRTPDSYIRRSRPDSHIRRSRPDSYIRRSRPDSYIRRSRPDSYIRRSRPDSYIRRSRPDSYIRRSTHRNQLPPQLLRKLPCELCGDMPVDGRLQRSRLFPDALFGHQQCQGPQSFATSEARRAPQSVTRHHRQSQVFRAFS